MKIFRQARELTDSELPAIQGTDNYSGEIARNIRRTQLFGEHVAALQAQVVPADQFGFSGETSAAYGRHLQGPLHDEDAYE